MLAIFWLRRDLRLSDNHGLFQALLGPLPVLPLFIFDTEILDHLADKKDARVTFIHRELEGMKRLLEDAGSALLVANGQPAAVWEQLLARYPVGAVYCNHDYEPYAIARDNEVQQLLAAKNIPFHSYKDHVIFERLEVAKADGLPYTVFTPYSKVWRKKLAEANISMEGRQTPAAFGHFPSEQHMNRLYKISPQPMPTLPEIGFEPSAEVFPEKSVSQGLIRNYDQTRNIPAIQGTTRLGVHFRFGTISIREKARKALGLNDTFLNELIWRDFYAMILANFPHVAGRAFRPEYDLIAWRHDEQDFLQWCQGKTGYPIVDAGMRELNATGYMHNRVRMIVASFLTKHLLIDWRWGEAYFAEKLLDFDLASNNGGWQWAAGSGTDAAPYFRIFNPTEQQKKFDPEFKYIRRWVPEFGTSAYPQPMVDHRVARERCLEVYKEGLALGKKKF
ncbi:MAG: cryptochrome/photolyase family protein [Saprospiraceae bacterium]|jgi:deoxyribodipyrimidine photo-lyase